MSPALPVTCQHWVVVRLVWLKCGSKWFVVTARCQQPNTQRLVSRRSKPSSIRVGPHRGSRQQQIFALCHSLNPNAGPILSLGLHRRARGYSLGTQIALVSVLYQIVSSPYSSHRWSVSGKSSGIVPMIAGLSSPPSTSQLPLKMGNHG